MKKVYFIDCGANIGQSINWAIQKYGNNLDLIDSFEILPQNFKILESKYGGRNGIRLNPVAVWTQKGKVQFYPQTWGARTGSSVIEGKSSTDKEHGLTVTPLEMIELWNLSDASNFKSIVQQSKFHNFITALTLPENDGEVLDYPDGMSPEDMIFLIRNRKPSDFSDPSTLKKVEDYINFCYSRHTGPMWAECIDLADWIKKNKKDYHHLVLKMDIEGAEEFVLPHLFSTGIDKLVDEWLVEFHGTKIKGKTPAREEFSRRVSRWVDWGEIVPE